MASESFTDRQPLGPSHALTESTQEQIARQRRDLLMRGPFFLPDGDFFAAFLTADFNA